LILSPRNLPVEQQHTVRNNDFDTQPKHGTC
jgi:hypothetical protein